MKISWVLIILVLFISGCLEYSDGQRVGIVTKFSQKGLIWKTWEGELRPSGREGLMTSEP